MRVCPNPLAAGVMARGPPVSIKTTNPERKLVFLIIVVRATKGDLAGYRFAARGGTILRI